MSEQDPSPWAPPRDDSPANAGMDAGCDRLDDKHATWREAAASTADPRWARPAGGGTVPTAGPGDADGGRGPVPDPAKAVRDEIESLGNRYLWGAPIGVGNPGAARVAGARPGPAGVFGGLLVVAAGIMTTIASGMTWATIRALGLVEIPVKGTDADQFGGTTLLLGVLCVVVGVLLAGSVRAGWGWILAAVAGSMIVLMAVVDLFRLLRGSRLNSVIPDISVEIGPGLWITLAGGIVVVTGALLARFGSPAGPST